MAKTMLIVRHCAHRLVVCAILGVAGAGACTSFAAVPKPPRQALAETSSKSAWITLTGGERMSVTSMRVLNDSLRGKVRGESSESEIAIPLDAIRSVEVERFSVAMTLGGIALAVGVYFAIAAAMVRPL